MKLKRSISIFLAAIMLLSLCACGKADSGDMAGTVADSEGKYAEEKLELPLPEGAESQGMVGMFAVDGALNCVTAVSTGENESWHLEYYRHTMNADGTWQTESEKWLNDCAPQGGNMMSLKAGGDGTLYMLFSDYDENSNLVNHILISRDGGETGQELQSKALNDRGMLFAISPLDAGRIAIQAENGDLFVLDADGNMEQELEAGNGYGSLASYGNKLAAYAPSGKAVRIFDLDSGTSVDWDIQLSEVYTQMQFSTDGTLYMSSPTGLYSHRTDGTLWERLIDGDACNLGLPDYYVAQMLVMTGDTDTVYAADYSAQLFSYSYDPKASTVVSDTLEVFSLTENAMVQQAIVDFNRSHSGVKASYTIAENMAGGATAEDYIKALNTQLLAGDGPDVIILDGLPLNSYIEKDVLADISATVDAAEPMLPNIRSSASQENGAVYAIPLGFELPIALTRNVDSSVFNSLDELCKACETSGDMPFLSSSAYSYETLAELLLSYYDGELLSGGDDSIESFLKRAKSISDAIGCTDRLGGDLDIFGDASEEEIQEVLKRATFIPQLFDYTDGLVDNIVMTAPSLDHGDCMIVCALADQYGGSLGTIDRRFIPLGLAGINKATENPQLAADFITALLGSDSQKAFNSSTGFPVNKAVLDKYFAKTSSNFASGYNLNGGKDITAEWPNEERREDIMSIILGAETPVYKNAEFVAMVSPAIVSYMDGSRSLQEAEEELGSVLNTYLSE